jgi:hypothetical protein
MVKLMKLMKMQTLNSFAFSVLTYHSTWCNISRDLTVQYYGSLICYPKPHKNTDTFYYKNNSFTVPCNMLQTGGSSSGVNGKNEKGGNLLLILKQISNLQNIIVISRLYKISLTWPDLYVY